MTRLYAVVLAAGAGTRFGGSKLTSPWRGGVLLDGALSAAFAAPVDGVIIVTGAHRRAVEAVVAGFACVQSVPIRTIWCADHAAGMSASLACGLAALPPGAIGAFIFLGDMPAIPAGLSLMLAAALTDDRLAAVPSIDGRMGHPVLIARALFDKFAHTAGDGAGSRLLKSLGTAVAQVSVHDCAIFADADTRSALIALEGSFAEPPK